MKRKILVSLCCIALFACSNQPSQRYQVSTAANGVTIRIDTQTGRSEMLVQHLDGTTEWVPVGTDNRATKAAAEDAATLARAQEILHH